MADSERKKGWERVKFGDVVRLVTDRCDPVADGIERYVGLEHVETEDLRIRRWGLVAEGVTFTNRFKAGQVLFGKRRAYQRKVAVADFGGVCSGDIYVFEPANDRLLPELLPFICQTESFFEYAVKTSAGSLSPRTNWKSLAEYEFAFPPLDEQHRLYLVYESIQRVREEYRTAIADLRDARERYASDAFTRDMAHRQAFSEHVAESMYGPRFSNSLYSPNGPVMQVRTTDITDDGQVRYEGVPRVNLEIEDVRSHLLVKGDLLFSRTGTCGLTAIFEEQEIPAVPAAYLIRFRLRESLAPFYAHEFFLSGVGRMISSSISRGAVQMNISASELLRQQVPCPSLSRQAEVVSRLKEMRESESALAARVEALQMVERQFQEASLNV